MGLPITGKRMFNNSDGHCQIYTALKDTLEAFEGESLKWKISGTHTGHKWVLQYMGADIQPHHGEGSLLHFEG